MNANGDSTTTALRGQTVLVLEDEYFLATELRRVLTRAGAAVVGPFPTLAEGRAAVAKVQGIDAALLDVNLRGEMVFPLLDELRERGVAFVFMTGYDRAALPPAYRDVPICEKPVVYADFLKQLAAARASV